jgi:hypothetical protein
MQPQTASNPAKEICVNILSMLARMASQYYRATTAIGE